MRAWCSSPAQQPSLAHPCPSFCVQLGREVVAGLCDVDAGVAFAPLLPGVGPGRPPSAPPLLLDVQCIFYNDLWCVLWCCGLQWL